MRHGGRSGHGDLLATFISAPRPVLGNGRGRAFAPTALGGDWRRGASRAHALGAASCAPGDRPVAWPARARPGGGAGGVAGGELPVVCVGRRVGRRLLDVVVEERFILSSSPPSSMVFSPLFLHIFFLSRLPGLGTE